MTRNQPLPAPDLPARDLQAPDLLVPARVDPPAGLALAIAAYLMWGFLPLYMKLTQHIPVLEVLAARVIWSVPVAGAVLIWQRRTRELMRALRTPRMLGMAAITAALISVNWAIYIWAVVAGHTMDAAIGYYINPLFSVFLGAVVLRERLSRAQWLAIGLATLAVVVLTLENGKVPLVALSLMLTFGLYGYAKKKLPIGPNQGFMLEVLLLTPPALIYLVWLQVTGQSHFLAAGPQGGYDTMLLLGCGLVTAVPLMAYGNGAKLLRLSTIGILQYIAPTIIFLLAIFLFGEPFGRGQMIAFPMIWAALVIYTAAMVRQTRRARR